MQQELRVSKVKWKNLLCAVCATVIAVAILSGMFFIQSIVKATLAIKIICVIGFTLLSVALVFTVCFFLNAVRNLFAGTVLKLTENGLKLPKRNIIPYTELENVTVDDKNTLHIRMKNGEDVCLRQKKMNLPSVTIAQAINNRKVL